MIATPRPQVAESRTMSKRIVLPADIYDTLEMSALAYGGIGAGRWHEGGRPVCYVGHLADAGAIADIGVIAPYGISEARNDRPFRGSRERIAFPDWCKHLNVVRGA